MSSVDDRVDVLRAWLHAHVETTEQRLAGEAPARPDPGRYHCILDEAPSHLVPARLLTVAETAAPALSPRLYQVDDGPPPAWLPPLPAADGAVHLGPDVLWVGHETTSVAVPYVLGPRMHPLVAALRAGAVAPHDLEPADLAVLRLANVVVDAADAQREAAAWHAVAERTRATFAARGFAPVAGLVPPLALGALRRYYRHRIRTNGLELGDSQSHLRFVGHEEPVATFFHRQLGAAMSALTGVPVKPSYVYVAAYQGGARLPEHCDRAQCEYSLTLAIDRSPEHPPRPWPIKLRLGEGEVAFEQELGDALLYRGPRIPHWRDPLPPDQSSTSLLLHFVDEDFDGPLA